jgi:hypothetical protein
MVSAIKHLSSSDPKVSRESHDFIFCGIRVFLLSLPFFKCMVVVKAHQLSQKTPHNAAALAINPTGILNSKAIPNSASHSTIRKKEPRCLVTATSRNSCPTLTYKMQGRERRE